jgi:Zn-dependent peptidase ImmA (M78 family)
VRRGGNHLTQGTWSGDWAIPTHIKLPGCRVKVRVVPQSVLNGCDGAAVYSHDKDKCMILIDETLDLQTQRYTLLHELQHVMVEVLDIMLEHYPDHVQLARTRRPPESSQ